MELLTYGKFYHIFNRGINSCDLFNENDNYEHFLCLYFKHISPFADTYAWVLMKNHFHMLVKIKGKEYFKDPQGFKNLEGLGFKLTHQPFSNLFNAYTKAFNKRYERTGSLFEHPFKRKLIDDNEYFNTLVLYIHNNPVHHGITKLALDYPWSSYLTCVSDTPTWLQRDMVLAKFENADNFKSCHDRCENDMDIEKWLGL